MSRHPRLYPKSQIPGVTDGISALGSAVIPISGARLEPPQQSGEVKRHHRIFRTKRKHVLKACDRCRVKKTKCDGNQPCNRCSAYNHPCLFRERKATQTKVYSRGFVEMLESHHSLVVKALQKLYKHCINNEGFPGEPLVETNEGHPLTHAILDRLGLIKQAEEGGNEPAEDLGESLEYLRHLPTTTDCSETADPSPEPVSPANPSNNLERPVSPIMDDLWRWDSQPEHAGLDCHFSLCDFSNMIERPRPGVAQAMDGISYRDGPVSPTQTTNTDLFNSEFNYDEPQRRLRGHTETMTWPNCYDEGVIGSVPIDMFGNYRILDRAQPPYQSTNLCYNTAFPVV